MDSRRSCFIGNLLKVECDSKTDDLNEKYEEKRLTVVEKLIWRAEIKDENSKDRDKNNIICTNNLVEFDSKYISNQKYCCSIAESSICQKKVIFCFYQIILFQN